MSLGQYKRDPASLSRDSERLEAFSDAVIAIMLTLLSIELLRVDPESARGQGVEHSIVRMWPSFMAFGLSFLVVGQIWITHHNFFRFVQKVDQGLLIANLILLMFVALLPLSAKLLAQTLSGASEGDRRWAFALYAATSLGQALIFNACLWWAKKQHLLVDAMTADFYLSIRNRFLFGPCIYAFCLLLSFISPWLSLACYVGVILLYLTPRAGDLPSAREATDSSSEYN